MAIFWLLIEYFGLREGGWRLATLTMIFWHDRSRLWPVLILLFRHFIAGIFVLFAMRAFIFFWVASYQKRSTIIISVPLVPPSYHHERLWNANQELKENHLFMQSSGVCNDLIHNYFGHFGHSAINADLGSLSLGDRILCPSSSSASLQPRVVGGRANGDI